MAEEKYPGHLILLMAPSGSGKAVLVESLGLYKDQLHFIKTFTSRPQREGTTENPNYNFISREEFKSMIEDGGFIEWAEFSGNYYGTPRSEVLGPLQSGEAAFKEMELQGVEQMRTLVPKENLTVVYIEAGGWEMLRKRILARSSMTETELEMRQDRYEEESKSKNKADVVIENRDGQLEEAKTRFRNLVSEILDKVKKQ